MDRELDLIAARAGRPGAGSVSERITVALSLGDGDRLPEGYADTAAAWARLDGRQRRIVLDHLTPRGQAVLLALAGAA